MNTSTELETSLLRALLVQPALLENCELRDSDFPKGQFRDIFSEITAIWEEGRPAEIDPVVLAGRLGGNGVYEFVSSLMSSSISLDLKLFHDRILELRRRAITARIKSKLHEQEKAPEFDLSEVRPDLEALDRLRDESAQPADFLMTGAQMKDLDLHVTWTLDKLIPERSLTVLHGPGGIGKTWLALAIVKAISEGVPFLGLQTKQCPVIYIDRENPWPTVVERVAELGLDLVRFWHLSFPTIPPKLDGPDWALYKRLPRGCFLVYDTARSCHDGKGNDDDVAALVMGRLKELRELGQTILLLDHTPRANERISKGSGAWTDLADQVLAFYRMKPGTFVEIEEEGFDPNALLYFGTGNKTRFERFKLHLAFGASNGTFTLAEDPGTSALDALANYIAGEGLGKNQSEIIAWAKAADVGPKMRENFIGLLKRGEREGRWRCRIGFKGAKLYEPTT